jgi:hypothetical protein
MYRVQPKEEILHKSTWYKPGELMPDDYVPETEQTEDKPEKLEDL